MTDKEIALFIICLAFIIITAGCSLYKIWRDL